MIRERKAHRELPAAIWGLRLYFSLKDCVVNYSCPSRLCGEKMDENLTLTSRIYIHLQMDLCGFLKSASF